MFLVMGDFYAMLLSASACIPTPCIHFPISPICRFFIGSEFHANAANRIEAEGNTARVQGNPTGREACRSAEAFTLPVITGREDFTLESSAP